MLWRVTHEFLRWIFPALFAGALALAGLCVSAAQVWPEAKDAVGAVFVRAILMLSNPWTYVLLVLIFSVWLAAFIWSGIKLEAIKAKESDPFASFRDEDGVIVLDGGMADDT